MAKNSFGVEVNFKMKVFGHSYVFQWKLERTFENIVKQWGWSVTSNCCCFVVLLFVSFNQNYVSVKVMISLSNDKSVKWDWESLLTQFFLISYLAAAWPTSGHCWGCSLTKLRKLITAFTYFYLVGSQGPVKHRVGFELGTFWLIVNCKS